MPTIASGTSAMILPAEFAPTATPDLHARREECRRIRRRASVIVKRESDAREIDEIVARQQLAQSFGLGQREELARRRTVPPVVKAPLAILIRPNDVETRHAPREPDHKVGADAFRAPAG
jgi:hypothetical protein